MKISFSPRKVAPLVLGLSVSALTCLRAAEVAPAFASDYSIAELGSVAGVPASYGGITFLNGDPNTLLIGGSANGAAGAIYSIGVTRDVDQHITGFSGTASLFASAPYIDGGLSYGPGGVLFYAGYPTNQLGQIKPGSSVPDKVIDLNAFGIASSVGAFQMIPSGFPGSGSALIASYNSGNIYSALLVADGNGTYDLASVQFGATTGSGPEGLFFVPGGSPLFTDPTLLISEYGAGRISAFDLDANGIPIPPSRRDFITGLGGAEGAVVDPVTGDFLFSTFGGGNQIVGVRGFAVPETSSTLLVAISGVAALSFRGSRRRA